MRNKILPLGLNAIVAKVYKDKSWLDKKECIVLDYSETSLSRIGFAMRFAKSVAGTYLGLVYWGKKKLIDFALEFPASG